MRILFGFSDQVTADTLGLLAGSIVATSLFFMVARVFYALEDTKTPLFVSLASIILNISISIPLSRMYGVAGLGLALSITGFAELIILLALLRRKIGDYGLSSIFKSALKITTASLAMSTVMYLMVRYLFPLNKSDIGFSQLAPQFTLICLVGLILFYISARSLGVPEIQTVTKIVRKNINKVVHRG